MSIFLNKQVAVTPNANALNLSIYSPTTLLVVPATKHSYVCVFMNVVI
jgi:hypothetical protein